MIDFKEYSRQRDIAVKRVKRLQQSGIKMDIHIPTVKELRAKPETAEQMAHALGAYLEHGASLSRYAERRRKSVEDRAEAKRQYSRDYRRRTAARKYEEGQPGKAGKYQGYLKGLKTLGVDLKPSQLPGFFKYMDYRFAQGNASRKYVFDIFTEDYKALLQKGYKPDQILSDYEKFSADQAALSGRAAAMNGVSVTDAIASWDRFVK